MSFKILPVLAAMWMFLPISKAIGLSEDFSLASNNDPETSSIENLDRLKEVHDYDEVFDEYETGSTPSQS